MRSRLTFLGVLTKWERGMEKNFVIFFGFGALCSVDAIPRVIQRSGWMMDGRTNGWDSNKEERNAGEMGRRIQ